MGIQVDHWVPIKQPVTNNWRDLGWILFLLGVTFYPGLLWKLSISKNYVFTLSKHQTVANSSRYTRFRECISVREGVGGEEHTHRAFPPGTILVCFVKGSAIGPSNGRVWPCRGVGPQNSQFWGRIGYLWENNQHPWVVHFFAGRFGYFFRRWGSVDVCFCVTLEDGLVLARSGRVLKDNKNTHRSGQIIATSHDLGP